jgi:hypothetical protein
MVIPAYKIQRLMDIRDTSMSTASKIKALKDLCADKDIKNLLSLANRYIYVDAAHSKYYIISNDTDVNVNNILNVYYSGSDGIYITPYELYVVNLLENTLSTLGITVKVFERELREFLGYTSLSFSIDNITKSNSKCPICGKSTHSGICRSCLTTIRLFTKCRRESFVVPITTFNFPNVTVGTTTLPFEIKFDDWDVRKEGDVLIFNLMTGSHNGVKLDYTLPFVEFQRPIHL